jgi:hypothetical protein
MHAAASVCCSLITAAAVTIATVAMHGISFQMLVNGIASPASHGHGVLFNGLAMKERD